MMEYWMVENKMSVSRPSRHYSNIPDFSDSDNRCVSVSKILLLLATELIQYIYRKKTKKV